MALVNATPKRWTREVYYEMAEKGIFAPDERVELLEGAIVPVSPQGREHARLISFLNTKLVRAFGATHVVRVQLPLDLGQDSQPEPDICLVSLEEMRKDLMHPEVADLVIEVAHSSLNFDRHEKASIYAKAGLSDYWILNTKARQVEVYRRPAPNPEAAFAFAYSLVQILRVGESIAPLFASELPFTVEELLRDGF